LGARTNCMAALSTYIWESSTAGDGLALVVIFFVRLVA